MSDPRTNVSGATNDDHLVDLWLVGRPDSTKRVYRQALAEFREQLPKAFRDLTVADVLEWSDRLPGRDATRARKVATVKSLLTFAWRTGFLTVNVGRSLRCVKVADDLHERILTEETVQHLVGFAKRGRDRCLIRLLYGAGLRVGEALGLRPVDVGLDRVTVLGKGKRTRTIGIPRDLARDLLNLMVDREGVLFRTVRGAPLRERAARQIVYDVAESAGVELSPHWLRHAHASHALDRGAPIHVVQKTLGHKNVSTTSRYLHVKPGESSSQWLPAI